MVAAAHFVPHSEVLGTLLEGSVYVTTGPTYGPPRVLSAPCDVCPARMQYVLTPKNAKTGPMCTVCNGWGMLLVFMGKTPFEGII